MRMSTEPNYLQIVSNSYVKFDSVNSRMRKMVVSGSLQGFLQSNRFE